jgi:hypothetical protein
MFYLGILSYTALVIITTSPCGWVVLSHVWTIPPVITMADSMEWWTPMKGKREGKRALARECWTRRWEKELTLPKVIHYSIVLFSHRLPSHWKSDLPATHVISEASAMATMATLASHGVAVDADEEWED